MTCVIGLIDDGKVYVGADSAGTDGYLRQTIRADEKIFTNGKFIMGSTGSYRMKQLLRYKLDPPRRHPDDDVYKFLVVDFIDAVRQCLKDGGWASKENDNERGGTFIMGYEGELYTVYADYQVAKSTLPYIAIGCGEEYAMGSLYSTEGGMPRDRIITALSAAEEFSAGVRGPFDIICDDE